MRRPTTALAACLVAPALVLSLAAPVASATIIGSFQAPATETVTTDSVVATVTVRFGASGPALVTVDWGDGTTSAEDPNRPTNLGQPADPPGTAVLQHAYAPPTDGSAFTRVISGNIGPAQSFQALATLIPRFRVSAFPQAFHALSNCDPVFEVDNEWHLEQTVMRAATVLRDTTWDLTIPVASPAQPLPGSEISFDMTMADRSIRVFWNTEEVDPLFDDDLVGVSFDLHPEAGSHHVSLFTSESTTSTGCAVTFTGDVDVQLRRPGLSQGLAGAVG